MALTLSDGTQVDPQTLVGNTLPDPAAFKMMQVIQKLEGGNYENRSGDSGASAGAYQWNNDGKPLKPGEMPSHWKNAAAQYLHDSNAPMTPENQNFVAYQQIKSWKDQGLSPEEIDALWNGAKKDPATGKYTHVSASREQALKNLVLGQQPQQPNTIPLQFNPKPYSQPGQFDFTGINAPKTAPTIVPPSPQHPFSIPGVIGQFAGDVAARGKDVANFALNTVLGGPKRFTEALMSGAGAIGSLLAGNKQAAAQQIQQQAAKIGPHSVVQGAADALQSAALVTPVTGAGTGALTGAMMGTGSALNKEQTVGSGLTGAVIGGGIGAALGGLIPLLTKTSGITPQMENALKDNGISVDEYNSYITAAKNRAGDIRAGTPLTMAADQLDKAASMVSNARDAAGEAVGVAKKTVGNDPVGDVTPVLANFISEVRDRFGLQLSADDAGNIVATPIQGSMRQIPTALKNRIVNVFGQLQGLQDGGTIGQAVDVSSNLTDLIDYTVKDEFGKTVDPLAGLLQQTDGMLRGTINATSPEMAAANANFQELQRVVNEISSMAGTKLQRGELLMKRVFSGDFGTNVVNLFQTIKDVTGIDLVNHAILAKHAIDSVGDASQRSLLQQALESGAVGNRGGLMQALVQMGRGLLQNTVANPINVGRNIVTGGGLMEPLINAAVKTGSNVAPTAIIPALTPRKIAPPTSK